MKGKQLFSDHRLFFFCRSSCCLLRGVLCVGHSQPGKVRLKHIIQICKFTFPQCLSMVLNSEGDLGHSGAISSSKTLVEVQNS